MYYIKVEKSFDAAHFLKGYDGKCKNIHGHHWRVIVCVKSKSLEEMGQTRGMVTDFSDLKKALQEEVNYFDHSLIYETESLKPQTICALLDEDFKIREVPFRPTAENFARDFYQKIQNRGYQIDSVTVYETPDNCAEYREAD